MKQVKPQRSASSGSAGVRTIYRFPVEISRRLAIQTAVLCAALSTVYLVFRFYSPLPKWDQWAEILWLKNYYAGQWHVSDLWRQHNEHRILFPRLFLLTDLLLFKGRNVFLFISMLALQAAHCSIFLRQMKSEKGLSSEERLFLWSVFILLFFSAGHLDNFTWGFQVSFVLVFLAGTISIQSLLQLAEAWKCGRLSRAGYAWLAMSIAAATIASYSLASGILIWPTLIVLAIGLRLPKSWIGVLCASGTLVIWVYFLGYYSLPGHTNAKLALRQPLEMIFYAAAFIAIPVSRLQHSVGVAVGLVQMFFTGWLVVRLMLGRIPFHRLFLLSLGNMVFIIATAFLTAAGRMALSPPEAAVRYNTPALLFWICCITICLSERDVLRWGVKNRLAIVASATATWFVLAMVPMTLSEAQRFNALRLPILDAETALLVNVHDAARVRTIYPDPTLVIRSGAGVASPPVEYLLGQ